jgi:hypothetical protein
MTKHLIPDPFTAARLPYRLLTESWWLDEDFTPTGEPCPQSLAVAGSHISDTSKARFKNAINKR